MPLWVLPDGWSEKKVFEIYNLQMLKKKNERGKNLC